MELKVYKRNEKMATDARVEELPAMNVTAGNVVYKDETETNEYYENPKLLRRDGIYYIGYETDQIAIEEWEAIEVYEHPELVYDVIVSHRRKYYFNTAEDTIW